MLKQLDPDQHPRHVLEINRIFRTDAFNISRRRHEEDVFLGKYPFANESCLGKSMKEVLGLIQLRKSLPQVNLKKKQIFRSEFKPFCKNLSSFSRVTEHSPVLAVDLPS